MKTIGVVGSLQTALDMNTNEYYSRLLQGIETACVEREYDLLISTRRQVTTVAEFLRLFYEGKVQGLIFLGAYLDAQVQEEIDRLGIPVSAVSFKPSIGRIDHVNSENAKGVEILVDTLVSLGHTKLGFIGTWQENDDISERFEGFYVGLKKNGIPFDPAFHYRGDFSRESAAHIFRKLIHSYDRPTALVCASDFMAMGVLHAARELDVTIPAHVSVTGFDAFPEGRMFNPSLQSVYQPLEQMGYRAANFLCNRIENPRLPVQSERFPIEIIRGESIGAPPSPGTDPNM